MANRYESPELIELGPAEEIVLGTNSEDPPDNAVGYADKFAAGIADRDE